MDFFASQDTARKNTKLLVFYFVVAVALIITAIYFTALVVFQGATGFQTRGEPVSLSLWNLNIFLGAAGGTLAVIISGSLFKSAQLARGGSAVAESLGGRLLNSNTRDLHERKLLNVVEEMAIASGVPVPKVYVMDQEPGINAFAAGHTINDAAIGVTRGCITSLTRDELQGVIAHEFSHILNGDMRLNLRLMGIIFGIICLTVIGRILLRARGGSRDRNPLPLLGIVLIILGWIGVIFGQLIQAAVSRQREFLADAAAVQFTRNPDGIAGALKKIGAAHTGSKVINEHAAEASHMFFGSAHKSSLTGMLATHPPLDKRIRAIEPNWDGKLPRFAPAPEVEKAPPKKAAPGPAVPPVIPGLPGLPKGAGGLAAAAAVIEAASVLPNLGNPTPQHLRYAEELRESLSETIQDAAHDPQDACALLYALLLSGDSTQRANQLKELSRRTDAAVTARVLALEPDVRAVVQRTRLPLVNLALPALRQLSPAQFQHFSDTVQWLIESDQQIVLFEFVLQKIIHRQLDPHFKDVKPRAAQYYSVAPLVPDAAVLLSALAYTGATDPTEISRAFTAGLPHLRAPNVPPTLRPPAECGLVQINTALDRLVLAAPQIKKNLLTACIHVVGADGVIHENEAELLRGVAETLDCPLPPFVSA
jgi:Zn-dependent protease with chaperone function